MLWVIIRVVSLFFSIRLSDSSSTFAAVAGSSAAVCSSSRSSLGLLRVAIRSVNAWRWPPESRPTFTCSLSSRPKPSSLSFSRYSSLSCLETIHFNRRFSPRRIAMARFSSIHISGAVPIMGSWKTRPMSLARRYSGRPVMSSPASTIEPLSTGQTPAIAFRTELFPAPLLPMTVTKSPSFRWRLRLSSAFFSLMVPGLKVFEMLLTFSNHFSPFPSAAAACLPAWLNDVLA